jgi:plasmid stabilization system protein ParE
MSFWLHPDAEEELGVAAAHYDEQASPDIAQAFLTEYERVIGLLIENQQRGPHTEHGLRIYHLHKFPYSLIYAENLVYGPQIYAVAHQRREPGYWVGRA